MAGLHVHRSNLLETLADALSDVTRAPMRAVLEPEIVVVQSLGMRRWLALEIARRAGVSMNVRFPFPAAFADEVLRAALPESPANESFSRDVLPWRVLALFPRMLGAKGFEELRRYTAGEPRALKQFQLAQKIAGIFDRYVAYRPQWLLDWQAGRESHWQAQLWRELVREHAESNPPRLAQRVAAALRGGKVDAVRLP
ncbi:MAG TPA: exodeoxyribonuclease V subunit gamma, partial [Chthoniobacteraceae bacterium]|nr:exodeoxyribonuclease V subunit gamma [Chthoniobacteraceae bacterium]